MESRSFFPCPKYANYSNTKIIVTILSRCRNESQSTICIKMTLSICAGKVYKTVWDRARATTSWQEARLEVNEMRMLRWMCGVTRRGKIRNKHNSGTTRVVQSIEWISEWVSDGVRELVSEWVRELVAEWVSDWVRELVAEWVSGWLREWLSDWEN